MKHLRSGWIIIIGSALGLSALADPPATAPIEAAPTLLRVPSEAQLLEAKKLVDSLYARDIAAATTGGQKLDLAESLITTAMDEKKDHGGQFQVLITARDLAIQGRDLALACRSVTQLGSLFYIDTLQYQAAAASAFRGVPVAGSDRRLLCLQIESLVQSMLAAGRFDLIAEMDETAKSVAATSNDNPLVRQIRKASEAHAIARLAYDGIPAAIGALKSDPNDTRANTTIGRYDCFDLDDWQTGLPLLARGSDGKLKQAAQLELLASEPAPRKAVADAWWAVAEDQPEAEKRRIQAHAGELYTAALASLSGTDKAEAQRRIAIASTFMSDASTAVDLLALVDPSRDSVDGDWDLSAVLGTLHCKEGDGRIVLPYTPPAEYDLRISFTRADGDEELDAVCLGGGGVRQFCCDVGAVGNTLAGLSLVECHSVGHNPTGVRGSWIENGRRYTLVVKVRSHGVQALLDDKPIGPEYRTDFRDLNPSVQLGRGDVLGIAVNRSEYVIHSAYVVEVNGHGHTAASGDEPASPVVARATYLGPGNHHEPFTATFHADGTVEGSFGGEGVWSIRASDLCFRWGAGVVACKLSGDRKTFVGKHLDNGAPVSGQFVEGSI